MGVYDKTDMIELLSFLNETVHRIENFLELTLTVRFHPLCDLSRLVQQIFGGKVLISKDPIENLVSKSDIVLCGAQSSVCVDVLIAGKKPVVFCPKQGLLMNPLFGSKNAIFVSSVDQLVSKVALLPQAIKESTIESFFEKSFNSNSSLLLWLRLLQS